MQLCDKDIISDKIVYMTAMDKVNKDLRIWKQAEEIFRFLNCPLELNIWFSAQLEWLPSSH